MEMDTLSRGKKRNVALMTVKEALDDIGLMKRAVETTLDIDITEETLDRSVTLGRMFFIKMYHDTYGHRVKNCLVYKTYMPNRVCNLTSYYIRTVNSWITTDTTTAALYRDCMKEYERLYKGEYQDPSSATLYRSIEILINKIDSRRVIEIVNRKLTKRSEELQKAGK